MFHELRICGTLWHAGRAAVLKREPISRRFGTWSARFSKPRCAPSNRGRGGLPEHQSIPWLADDLLDIMSDNVQ